jgi:hypothetical protein
VAVSVPRRHGQGLQFHAVCGAQYSTEVQQRPLTATSQRDHQHTDLAGATAKRPAAPIVRDEEAAVPDRLVNDGNSRSLADNPIRRLTCI